VRITPSTIAIVGGIIPDANGDGSFETTTLVQIYNATSQTWTRAADLPVALNHPNVAAINGKIYVLGGLTPAEEGVWRATGSSWEYTPDSDKWRALPSAPEGYEAGSAAMGVHGQTIILAGGMRLLSHVREGVQDTVDFVHAFDLSKGVWKRVPPRARTLPEGRDHAGAAVVNGTMYILGGRFRGQNNVKDTVFALDLGCNMARGWSVRGTRMPTPRGGLAAAAVEGVVYTFGGEGNKEPGSMGVFPQAEAYDVDKDEWTRLRNMTNPRHGTYAAPLDGGVVIPGGGDRQGGAPMDLVEVFYP
jgi:N-acetylneuraminic acid mutarotase